MKYLFLTLYLFLSFTLHSQQIIIFGKQENCSPGNDANPCYPEGKSEIDFLNNFKEANFSDTTQTKKASLITPPLDWGRKVSDSTYGEIVYQAAFIHGFITDLSLFNLLPEHEYLLTLNGNPKLAGNNNLPDTVPGYKIERYYDFLSVVTDLKGNYKARIGILLKRGDYDVRFYVKDTDGFKIVLYHDYFDFKVE
jgi:hypothetical protein